MRRAKLGVVSRGQNPAPEALARHRVPRVASPSVTLAAKRKTSKKRLRRALVESNRWLRQERHVQPLPDLGQALARKRRSHFTYCGVTDNSRAVPRHTVSRHTAERRAPGA